MPTIETTERAESLLLSVVNDGASYPRRLEIARRKGAELLWRAVIREIANRENRTLETDWTETDIANTAPLLGDYMRRHLAEF